MAQSKMTYASYMLRFSKLQSDTQAMWVASIQSPVDGELRWFASVDALIQFLQHEFGAEEVTDVCDKPVGADDQTPEL